MADLILGPPGVLPPGEWAVGARCGHADYGPCVLVVEERGAWFFYTRASLTGMERTEDRRRLRLDLTTGPLDFGTRALLHLVAPDVGQPLCAPLWAQRYVPQVGGRWHLCVGDVLWVLDSREPCPRRALALALAAVSPEGLMGLVGS